jgi:hypothetical protein
METAIEESEFMAGAVKRITVDLSGYPDLVVVYLGMRVNFLSGIKTLAGFGPKIQNSVKAKPDGLLLHENLIVSLFPPHLGMRQYWRDFKSLETWTRSDPHRAWWKQFLRDSGGTGFWHETYFLRGGIEAIYDDVPQPLGLSAFAPTREARGTMFSSRQRLGIAGEAATPPPVAESDLNNAR